MSNFSIIKPNYLLPVYEKQHNEVGFKSKRY